MIYLDKCYIIVIQLFVMPTSVTKTSVSNCTFTFVLLNILAVKNSLGIMIIPPLHACSIRSADRYYVRFYIYGKERMQTQHEPVAAEGNFG